jgi:hypothetical protein
MYAGVVMLEIVLLIWQVINQDAITQASCDQINARIKSKRITELAHVSQFLGCKATHIVTIVEGTRPSKGHCWFGRRGYLMVWVFENRLISATFTEDSDLDATVTAPPTLLERLRRVSR